MRAEIHKDSGVAILMVLLAIALLAILVLGFASNMSTELRVSDAVEKTYRAQLLADGALSHAIETLRANIPDPAPLNRPDSDPPPHHWVTNPGRLSLIDPDSGELVHIPLHTGAAPDDDDKTSVDLNRPIPGYSHGPIANIPDSDERPEMRVAWIPVLRDPSKNAGPKNRMVGRYAFWIDDESTKINVSTALGKPNPQEAVINWREALNAGVLTPRFTMEEEGQTVKVGYSLGHPSSVNLEVLFSDPTNIEIPMLLRHSRFRGFHRYPDSILRYVDLDQESASIWYRENQWNFTFYNRSPEFNVFGEPRLIPIFLFDSLETGPSYQTPFYVDHNPRLQTLTGESGMVYTKEDEGDYIVVGNDVEKEYLRTAKEADAANVAKLAGAKMIYQYLQRSWPRAADGSENGGGSFLENVIEKSLRGEDSRNDRSGFSQPELAKLEAKQIALNLALFSRLGTAPIGGDGFASRYRNFVTSMNRHTHEVADAYEVSTKRYDDGGRLFLLEAKELDSSEQPRIPESDLWYLDDDFEVIENPTTNDVPLLPQTPGPHINEIKFYVTPEEVIGSGGETRFAFKIKYEVELFMHPFGPRLSSNPFSVKMDFLSFGLGSLDEPEDGKHKILNQPSWDDPNLLQWATFSGAIGHREGEEIDYAVVASRTHYLTSDLHEMDGGDVVLIERDEAQNNLKFHLKVRLGLGITGAVEADDGQIYRTIEGPRVKQLVPLPRFVADGQDEPPENYLEKEFEIENLDEEYVVSWEVEDPRVAFWKEDWKEVPDGLDSIGEPNFEFTPDADQESKLRYLQLAGSETEVAGYKLSISSSDPELDPEQGKNLFVHDWEHSRLPSVGYLSLIHTGIQSGIPWQTLSVEDDGGFPQWALLDLFAINYRRERQAWWDGRNLPNEWGSIGFMNSTAGKVNLNCRVYPQNSFFEAPDRTKPLEAVFRFMVDEGEEKTIAEDILDYQDDDQVFQYVGELARIWDEGDTAWEREKLTRNLASILTTNTNTFGVWGVAQVVHKAPGHILSNLLSTPQYDEFQEGDSVMGERRFYALVERYVWPGNDGVVGNGGVDEFAIWNKTADPVGGLKGRISGRAMPGAAPMLTPALQGNEEGSFAEIDGPTEVTLEGEEALAKLPYRKTSLKEANNPADPVMKYRVIFFRYLDS